MNWHEAAAAFPQIDSSDLARFQVSPEEAEVILSMFNRSVLNAQSDSADIAMIALKKLITRFPEWGEAALLFGICLALDGKLSRARASFEHALSVGLTSENMTYLAQACHHDASIEEKEMGRFARQEEEDGGKGFLRGLFSGHKKASIYGADGTDERVSMRAPILTRAPRTPGKARLATERERRDVLMQAQSASVNENGDEEIDVSIPKTPAEKFRISLFVLGAILVLAAVFLLVRFVAMPAYQAYRDHENAGERLDYLVGELRTQSSDPAISSVLAAYDARYPERSEQENQSSKATDSVTTAPQETTIATTGSPVSETPSQESSAAVSVTGTPTPISEATVSGG